MNRRVAVRRSWHRSALAAAVLGVVALSTSACVSPTQLAAEVKGNQSTTSQSSSSASASDSDSTRTNSASSGGSSSHTTPTPEAEDPENTGVLKINVGDCVKEDMASSSDTVYDAGKVDCNSPHRSELFHREDLPGGSYPGTSTVQDKAEEICLREFRNFIGKSYDSSDLELMPLYPLSNGWSRGDHAVDCYVSDPDADVTGSLRGAKR